MFERVYLGLKAKVRLEVWCVLGWSSSTVVRLADGHAASSCMHHTDHYPSVVLLWRIRTSFKIRQTKFKDKPKQSARRSCVRVRVWVEVCAKAPAPVCAVGRNQTDVLKKREASPRCSCAHGQSSRCGCAADGLPVHCAIMTLTAGGCGYYWWYPSSSHTTYFPTQIISSPSLHQKDWSVLLFHDIFISLLLFIVPLSLFNLKHLSHKIVQIPFFVDCFIYFIGIYGC